MGSRPFYRGGGLFFLVIPLFETWLIGGIPKALGSSKSARGEATDIEDEGRYRFVLVPRDRCGEGSFWIGTDGMW